MHCRIGVLLLSIALALPARASDTPTVASLRRVSVALRVEADMSAELLADRLSALGPVDLPAVFEHWRVATDADRLAASPRRAGLSEVQQKALLLAIKRMPVEWRSLLRGLTRPEALIPARRGAVRALREIGEAQDARVLLELACPPSLKSEPGDKAGASETAAAASFTEASAEEFETCVERMLERDAASFEQFGLRFFDADEELRPLLIEAISNRGTVAAVEVLTRLLGKDGELDLLLMTAIGKSAATVAPPFGKEIDETVRSMLSSDSADLVRETALVVGRLEDADAIQALVPLLSHANRGVRQNAYWSLKRISGLSFAPDQKTWAAWLKIEEVWWRDTAPELFARLEIAQRPEALDIVQQIARRRYPRHPLAVELARGLSHGDSEVRRLTCIALAQFRSRTAVAGLLACLDDSDPEVRTEAGRALRAVTGLDLPPVRAEWDRAGF